ncbi:type II toxin-antitoxin system PemK/MazF family toxin [Brevibacterium litoralis]|uniref:type II toxin-antitoxin system PemK/MazF family toxin n=1 Tax=Brevibacterium litoralis TaxID=3138935 RepID=UPI0032ECDC2F
MNWPLLRGQVVRADIGLDEPKLLVVVSNNRRNSRLAQVLAARLTTSAKPAIPSIVELSSHPSFTGRVVCDDIVEVYEDEVIGVIGVLSPHEISALNTGLKAALDLT